MNIWYRGDEILPQNIVFSRKLGKCLIFYMGRMDIFCPHPPIKYITIYFSPTILRILKRYRHCPTLPYFTYYYSAYLHHFAIKMRQMSFSSKLKHHIWSVRKSKEIVWKKQHNWSLLLDQLQMDQSAAMYNNLKSGNIWSPLTYYKVGPILSTSNRIPTGGQ